RLNGSISDAGVLLETLAHEEDCDEIARDRATDQRLEQFALDLETFFERHVAAFGDGVQSGEGSGQLYLRLGHDGSAGHGEEDRSLLLAEPDGLLLAAAGVAPGTRLLGP